MGGGGGSVVVRVGVSSRCGDGGDIRNGGSAGGRGIHGDDKLEGRGRARDACEAIDVEYEPLPPIVNPTQALAADAPLIRDDKENQHDNVIFDWEVGDRAGEAATLSNIGLVHQGLGDRRQALNYYRQALPGEAPGPPLAGGKSDGF